MMNQHSSYHSEPFNKKRKLADDGQDCDVDHKMKCPLVEELIASLETRDCLSAKELFNDEYKHYVSNLSAEEVMLGKKQELFFGKKDCRSFLYLVGPYDLNNSTDYKIVSRIRALELKLDQFDIEKQKIKWIRESPHKRIIWIEPFLNHYCGVGITPVFVNGFVDLYKMNGLIMDTRITKLSASSYHMEKIVYVFCFIINLLSLQMDELEALSLESIGVDEKVPRLIKWYLLPSLLPSCKEEAKTLNVFNCVDNIKSCAEIFSIIDETENKSLSLKLFVALEKVVSQNAIIHYNNITVTAVELSHYLLGYIQYKINSYHDIDSNTRKARFEHLYRVAEQLIGTGESVKAELLVNKRGYPVKSGQLGWIDYNPSNSSNTVCRFSWSDSTYQPFLDSRGLVSPSRHLVVVDPQRINNSLKFTASDTTPMSPEQEAQYLAANSAKINEASEFGRENFQPGLIGDIIYLYDHRISTMEYCGLSNYDVWPEPHTVQPSNKIAIVIGTHGYGVSIFVYDLKEKKALGFDSGNIMYMSLVCTKGNPKSNLRIVHTKQRLENESPHKMLNELLQNNPELLQQF